FLEGFLERGEPTGKLLRRLRQQGLPLGLLYGAYCPPHIHVRRPADQSAQPVQVAPVSESAQPLGRPLGAPSAAEEEVADLPDRPYLSLAPYEREHRRLFAARDEDVQRFAQVLDEAATRILLLHGESGVGKTSFLRAGVIPYLEDEG